MRSLLAEAEIIQAAFLRAVQEENDCEETGEPCQDENKCGCWLEMSELIRKEYS